MLRDYTRTILEADDVRQNLIDRGVDLDKTRVLIDEQGGVAVFLLFNQSGQMVGYQQYRPGASKDQNNNPRLGRYFTKIGKEGRGKKLAVWGIETITPEQSTVYVVEGIFDAVKILNMCRSVIATLTSDPAPIAEWLSVISKQTVGILDNDHVADSKYNMSHYVDRSYRVPDPYKDLGDMTQDAVRAFIEGIENGTA